MSRAQTRSLLLKKNSEAYVLGFFGGCFFATWQPAAILCHEQLGPLFSVQCILIPILRSNVTFNTGTFVAFSIRKDEVHIFWFTRTRDA